VLLSSSSANALSTMPSLGFPRRAVRIVGFEFPDHWISSHVSVIGASAIKANHTCDDILRW
jgi:hypothetical protein